MFRHFYGHAGSVAGAALLIVSLPRPAAALYLDPMTGSLILQVVVAGALTAWLTMKNSWARVKNVKNMFKRVFHRSDVANDDK